MKRRLESAIFIKVLILSDFAYNRNVSRTGCYVNFVKLKVIKIINLPHLRQMTLKALRISVNSHIWINLSFFLSIQSCQMRTITILVCSQSWISRSSWFSGRLLKDSSRMFSRSWIRLTSDFMPSLTLLEQRIWTV